ncbi:hypothetical protein HAX54_046216 [Datura stramonium]|uniref:DUF4219 domain-containing protein n=1 Tax=Datura stramonium TaxID=4076 RepID=A0ABS8WIV6_DATST|nr:hypothetical protein [Datura stramonium]
MSSMKFEIDMFSGHNNFNIWKIQMMALLRRECSIHAIDRKYSDGTSNSDKENIERDALSVIQMSLSPNVLCERHFEGEKHDEASGLFVRGEEAKIKVSCEQEECGVLGLSQEGAL